MKYLNTIHKSQIIKTANPKTQIKLKHNKHIKESPIDEEIKQEESIEEKPVKRLDREIKEEFIKNHEYLKNINDDELIYNAYNQEKELIENARKEENEKVLQEIKEREENKKTFGELKFIDGETAFFNNGEMLKRGQKFVKGHYYEGRTVVEINYILGFVRLNDNTIIKLSVSKP